MAGNVSKSVHEAGIMHQRRYITSIPASSYMEPQDCACARRAGAVHAANAAATAAALVRNSRRPFWLIAFLPKNFSFVTLIRQLLIRLRRLCVDVKKRRLKEIPGSCTSLPEAHPST